MKRGFVFIFFEFNIDSTSSGAASRWIRRLRFWLKRANANSNAFGSLRDKVVTNFVARGAHKFIAPSMAASSVAAVKRIGLNFLDIVFGDMSVFQISTPK